MANIDENSSGADGMRSEFPLNGQKPAVPSTTPFVQEQMPDGTPAEYEPLLSYDEEQLTDVDIIPNEETLHLTDVGAWTLEGVGNKIGPFSTLNDLSDITEGKPNYYRDCVRPSQQVKPAIHRAGTNVLIPFGASEFKRLVSLQFADGDQLPTGGPSEEEKWSAIEEKMDVLKGSINTRGSFRELRNWKRLSTLKEDVITYFNRSIPFTDLSTARRFAIELCYASDLGMLHVQFNAFASVLGYYKFLNKHNLGFKARRYLKNLLSPEVTSTYTQLYDAIAKLPVVDPTLHERINHLAALHTSRKKSGMWPCILLQDVVVDPLWRLRGLDVKSSAAYRCTTAATESDIVATTQIFPTFLQGMAVVEARAGGTEPNPNYDEKTLLQWLNNLLGFAQSIPSRYSMLLGAMKQLTLKGAVKYPMLQEYLPVKSVSNTCIEFATMYPGFNAYYKERFEYRPMKVAYETDGTTGNNRSMHFNLADLPSAVADAISQRTATFARPVGPYHGADSWRMDELADIGLFKEVTQNTDLPFRRWAFAMSKTTQSGGSVVDNAPGTPGQKELMGMEVETNVYSSCGWVDALYGDEYLQFGINLPALSSGNPTIDFGEHIALIGGADSKGKSDDVEISPDAPYLTLLYSPSMSLGDVGSKTSQPTRCIANGASFSDLETDAFASARITQFMAYLANQEDCTRFVGYVNPMTGKRERVLYVDTGYCQTQWLTISVDVLNSVLYAASVKLALPNIKQNIPKGGQPPQGKPADGKQA